MFKNRLNSWKPGHLSAAVLASTSLALAAAAGPVAANSQLATGGWALTVPKRRVADAPPAPPPPLPAGALSVKPATVEIAIRRGPASRTQQVVRQTVSRTSERIHLTANDGREWLFERNPIDPRRVSASLIEHASQAIVLYEETDLRMALGIRGWADVLALGFDTQVLGRYERKQDVRTIGGIRFARYASDATGGAADVWWSEDQALPSTSRSSVTRGSAESRWNAWGPELTRSASARHRRVFPSTGCTTWRIGWKSIDRVA